MFYRYIWGFKANLNFRDLEINSRADMNARNILVFLLLSSIYFGCKEESSGTQGKCYQGIVIGKIRSSGGGVAISMNETDLSTHEWKGFKNVVEALNFPDSLWQSGKKVFLICRQPTESEKIYPISADGDESAKPIVFVLKIATSKCPADKN